MTRIHSRLSLVSLLAACSMCATTYRGGAPKSTVFTDRHNNVVCSAANDFDQLADYLAAPPKSLTGSADDIYVSGSRPVALDIKYRFSRGKDVIGWYSLSDQMAAHALSPASGTDAFRFSPDWLFELVIRNLHPGSDDSSKHNAEGWRQAFFGEGTAMPEPAAVGLLAAGLAGCWVISRAGRIGSSNRS